MHYNGVQTDETFIINSLPQLPQLQIPAQFPPTVAPAATAMVTLMITDIQNNRAASYWRAAYHSRMSQQWYQNQEFGKAVQFAADLAELFLSQGNDLNTAASRAAQEAVQVTLAVTTMGNPQLLTIMDQQTLADFQGLQNRGQQLKGAIQNFKMMAYQGGVVSMQMPGMPMGQQGGLPQGLSGPMQTGSYNGMQSSIGSTGRPSTLGNVNAGPAPSAGSHWSPTNAPPINVGVGGATVRAPGRYDMTNIADDPGNAGGSNERAMTMVVNVPPGNVGNVNAATHQVGNTPEEKSGGFTWGVAPSKPEVVQPTAPHAAAALSPTRQYEPVAEMATDPNDLVQAGLDMRPFDLIITPDGMEVSPAALGHATFTGDRDQPYPMAYDPAEFMLAYIKTPDGRVLESLIEWTEQMDYLDNEINGDLAAKERQRRSIQSGKKVASGWVLAQALKPNWNNTMSTVDEDAIFELPPSTELVDVEISPFVADPSEVLIVDTLSAGIRKGAAGLKLAGAPGLDKSSIEMYMAIPQLFVFPDEEWAERAKALAQADSLDDLHTQLSKFKELEDADLLNSLDGRITAAVNGALVDGMALTKWSIDSFLGDWEELKAALVANFGNDEMLDILQENSTSIIDATFSMLDEANTTVYLTELGYFDPQHAAEEEAQDELARLAAEEMAAEAVELDNPEGEGELPTGDDTPAEVVATEVEAAGTEEVEDGAEFTFTNVVVFVDRISVTTIPQTREEISLRLDTGCLIVPSHQPALHAAASAIFARTVEVKMVYQHRYIMTADHKFLELKRGLLNDTALLIFDRGELF